METTITQELDSWNRERSLQELRSYVSNKLTSLPDHLDVE